MESHNWEMFIVSRITRKKRKGGRIVFQATRKERDTVAEKIYKKSVSSPARLWYTYVLSDTES